MHPDDAPPSSVPLFLAYLILPIQRHDENTYEMVKVFPLILSKN